MPGTDIFISYKSQQHSWAQRLAADLKRYGFSVFLDHDTARGLQSGHGWESQLHEAIRNADHFLLLWSSTIGVDSYVIKEIEVRKQAGGDVTVVRLDDSRVPSTLDQHRHQFRELVDLHASSAEADDVAFFRWRTAVQHLVDAPPLGTGRRSVVEIPTVVVAMTASEATELAGGSNVMAGIRGEPFEQMMALLQQSTPLNPQRYGDRAEDWRPFAPAFSPTDQTIEEVVATFDEAQRSWRREHPDGADDVRYAFVPYGDVLRDTDPDTASRALQHLRETPSLILFDPVSLMHQAVNNFVVGNGLHALTKAFVIGVGPHLATSAQPVLTYFGGVEEQLYNGLLMTNPRQRARSTFHDTLSTCVLNVSQPFELSRWLQFASENIIATAGRARMRMAAAYEPVVRHGGTLPSLLPGG